MTCDEFIKTLKEHHHVDFDANARLSAPPVVVACLSDSLARVVSSKEQVFYGVETSALAPGEPDGQGTLEWLLLIHGSLLRLTTHIAREDNRRVVRIEHSLYPLRALSRAIMTTDYQEEGGSGAVFRTARITLEFHGEKIQAAASLPSKTAEALTRLVRTLLA